MTLCACGCGGEVTSGRFLQGHGRKGHTHTQRSKDAISTAHIKYRTQTERMNRAKEIKRINKAYNESHKVDIKEAKAEYYIKHYIPSTNKESGFFLGVTIAEKVLSKVFKNVERMPNNTQGYDFICNHGKWIDVKSSTMGDKYGYWKFGIRHNQIADYFLCIAFNNRDDLYNPVHLWLIPGHIVNHLAGLAISKNAIDKWRKYELPLDKVISCCDSLR